MKQRAGSSKKTNGDKTSAIHQWEESNKIINERGRDRLQLNT